MENIKTIEKFDNPYDLLFEHDFDIVSNPDFAEYLKSVNDFESLVFYVINFDTVLTVDEITGDVYRIDTISSFYCSSIAAWLKDGE